LRGRGIRLDLGGTAVALSDTTGSTTVTECYPYGIYTINGESAEPRICVRVGDGALDLATMSSLRGSPHEAALNAPTLDALLGAGPAAWREVRQAVLDWAQDAPLIPLADITMTLPFTVADYVDFYASEHHATNLGRILRPGHEPLQPNWRHQPVGYHGRAGTVVVSGTPVVRPSGHVAGDDGVVLRPTQRLDVEVEVGFVVGVPSQHGVPVPIEDFADHVFGLVIVNDWSARDIQFWETVPLGPFLGKSFQTSISPWVVPLDVLRDARLPPPSLGTPLSPYLVESEPWGLDISLELRLNGELLSRPPYRTMHWSPAQLMAHLTVNGASLRTGDLYASGTVSGTAADEVGSLIERWGGSRFLDDGDEVVISATAPLADGSRIDLGDVRGRVVGR
jgi:fumarylacetoacetase